MCPAQAVKGPCAEPDPFWGAKLLGAPERASCCLGLPSVPLSSAPLLAKQEDELHYFHAMSPCCWSCCGVGVGGEWEQLFLPVPGQAQTCCQSSRSMNVPGDVSPQNRP